MRPDKEAAKNPAIDIVLKPIPSYPFPSGITLIKGVVKDLAIEAPEEQGVSGATVKIKDTEYEGTTTEKGEFVIYPRANREQTLNLVVTHPRYLENNTDVEVREGKTTIKVINDVEAI